MLVASPIHDSFLTRGVLRLRSADFNWDEDKHPRGEHGRWANENHEPGMGKWDHVIEAGTEWMNTFGGLELGALEHYTNVGHEVINASLRGEEVQKSLRDPALKKAAIIQAALLRAPHADRTYPSYRGLCLHNHELQDKLVSALDASWKNGDAVHFDGFLSSSLDAHTAELFAQEAAQRGGYKAGSGIILQIETHRQSYIATAAGGHDYEREVLHPHGCSYTVTGVWKSPSGLVMYTLREREDQPPQTIWPATFSWSEESHPRGEHGRWVNDDDEFDDPDNPDYSPVPMKPWGKEQEAVRTAGENWAESLPKETQRWIADYTVSGHAPINELLRGPKSTFKADRFRMLQAAAIQEAILKAPLAKKPFSSYRGLANSEGEVDKLVNALAKAAKSGHEVTLAGFQSASLDPDVAMSFAGDFSEDAGKVLFEIRSRRMSYVDSISTNHGEREVIHPHGASYNVTSVENMDGGWVKIVLGEDLKKKPKPIDVPEVAEFEGGKWQEEKHPRNKDGRFEESDGDGDGDDDGVGYGEIKDDDFGTKPPAELKEASEKWLGNDGPLDMKATTAICKYTDCTHAGINQLLRQDQSTWLPSDYLLDSASVIQDALLKAPSTTKPTLSYRGIVLDSRDDEAKFIDTMKIARANGKPVCVRGFQSSSIDLQKADKFITDNLSMRSPITGVMLRIESRRASYIAKISMFPQEREMLHPHGCHYKVTDVEEFDDDTYPIITLEEIEDTPPEQIVPPSWKFASTARFDRGDNWDESKHPRGEHGKWAVGATGEAVKQTPAERASFREKLTNSPAFKNWFGDFAASPTDSSKIVDGDGKPLVMYHGTFANDFDAFKSDKAHAEQGIYTTADPSYASGYATAFADKCGRKDPLNARVLPVYLNIRKPYFVLTKKSLADPKVWGLDAETIKILKSQGYDGMVVGITDYEYEQGYKKISDANEVVAFDGTQLKSATGNRGTYDPKDERINFSGYWDESQHPRGEHGRWTEGEAGGHAAAVSAAADRKTSTPAFKSWFGDSKVVGKDGKPLVVYHGTQAAGDFNVIHGGIGEYDNLDEMIGPHFAVGSPIADTFTVDQRTGQPTEGSKVFPVYLSIQNPRVAPQKMLANGTLEHDAYAINRDIVSTVFPQDRDLFVQWATRARHVTPEQAGEIFARLNRGESIGHDDYNGVAGHDLTKHKGESPIGSYVENYDGGLCMLKAADKRKVVDAYRTKMLELGYDGVAYQNTAPEEIKPGVDPTCYIAFEPAQIKSAIGNNGNYDRKDQRIDFSGWDEGKHPRGERGRFAENQIQSSAFKQWFKDSYVVDKNGGPLVVYHGTTKSFDAFDPNKIGTANDEGFAGHGFYFIDDPEWASAYAEGGAKEKSGEPQVMPVYLSMQNPLVLSTFPKELQATDWMKPENELKTTQRTIAYTNSLKANGYDGVIILNTPGNPSEYLVFGPEQIKSAIGNHGSFDSKDQRIGFSGWDEEKHPRGEHGQWSDVEGSGPQAWGQGVDGKWAGVKPTVFYRGTHPGRTERIKTGAADWDSLLFVADNKKSASAYGPQLEKVEALPGAKILYEGTKDFKSLAKGLPKGSLLEFCDQVAKRAKKAGYHAVWFQRQGDVGTAILDETKFTRGGVDKPTDSPAFKAWFAGSKVVNADGQPLTVYHGTGTAFEAFEKRPSIVPLASIGHWFTTEKNNAAEVASRKGVTTPVIVEAYLALKNPKVYPSFAAMLNDMGPSYEKTAAETEAFRKRLELAGHDGIHLETNTADGVRDSQYIAFEPTQIKSAIGNNGNYDPKDPRVLFSWDESRHPRGERGRWAADQIASPAFKSWFGDSKIADPAGQPLVMYHGTNRDFDSFASREIGSNLDTEQQSGAWGRGFYFTSSHQSAGKYATGDGIPREDARVFPVYLSIKNPLVLDWKNSPFSEWPEDAKTFRGMTGLFQDTRKATEWAKSRGYDGVVVKDTGNQDEVVAFEPTQIKSAIANNGEFNPGDHRIGFSMDEAKYPHEEQLLSQCPCRRPPATGKADVEETGAFPVNFYNENEPRDERGRWITGGAATSGVGLPAAIESPARTGLANPSEPTSAHAPVNTGDKPIYCGGNIKKAAQLLGQGKRVELAQPDQISTLLDRLAKLVEKAEKHGKTAPTFDLCLVSVPGTNLFCQDNLGIPRIKMPQLNGVPVPGTYAATLPLNKSGKVDLSAEFIKHLKSKGIKVEETKVRASHLRASQNEISGAKVARLVAAAKDGTHDLRGNPIFVTRDNYVVDGHHHWAATVGYGYSLDKDMKIPVHKLDLDIGTALEMANNYTKEAGLASASVAAFAHDVLKPTQIKSAIANNGDSKDHRIGFSWDEVKHPRGEHGRWASVADSPAFKSWFGDSKVTDEGGKPLVVYHGTADSFDTFNPDAGKELGGFGHAGMFFAADPDVAGTYAAHETLADKKNTKELGDAQDSLDEFREQLAKKTHTGVPSERVMWTWLNDLLNTGEITREEYDHCDELENRVYDLEKAGENSENVGAPSIMPAYLKMQRPKVVNANGFGWELIVPTVLADVDREKYDGVIFKNIRDNGDTSERLTTTYFVFSPTQVKSAIGNRGTYDPKDARSTFSWDETKHPRGEHGRFDEVASTEFKTPGVVLVSNYANMREGFQLKTPNGSHIAGYLYNADFPGDSESPTRGELFYAEVPKGSRREGTGKSLALDAIAMMKNRGTKTVNMATTSDEGRALLASLLKAGVISGPLRTSATGKAEYAIGGQAGPPTTPAFKSWFGNSKVVNDAGQPLVVYHGTDHDEFDAFTQSTNAHTQALGINTYFFTPNKAVASTYTTPGKGRLIPAYLSLQNPLVVDAKGGDWTAALGDVYEGLVTYDGPKDKIWHERSDEILSKYYPEDLDRDYDNVVTKDEQKELESLRKAAEAERMEIRKSLKLKHWEALPAWGTKQDGVIIKNVLDMTDHGVNDELHQEGSYNPFADVYMAFKPSQIKSVKNGGAWNGADDRIDFSGWDEDKHPRGEHGKWAEAGGNAAQQESHRDKLTKSPAFKTWFGDWAGDPARASKVVKSDGTPAENYPASHSQVMKGGKPVLVYHGTAFGDFDRFAKDKQNPESLYGPGFYFTEDKDIGEEYKTKGTEYTLDRPLTPKDMKKIDTWLNSKAVAKLFRSDIGIADGLREIYRAWKAGPEALAKQIAHPEAGWGNELRDKLKVKSVSLGEYVTKAVYLNIRNPIAIEEPMTKETAGKLADSISRIWETEDGKPMNAYLERLAEQGFSVDQAMGNISNHVYTGKTDVGHYVLSKRYYQKLFQAAGFDGITHTGGQVMGGGKHLHKVWIAFEPNQVKSANNRGTFDPADERLEFSAEFSQLGEVPAGQQNPNDPGLIDLEDVRQKDHFSCGACAAFTVGKGFGVGPDTLDGWKKALNTNVEESTRPEAIVAYLRQLGLTVEARDHMTLDDLKTAWLRGSPVICPVQDYGPFVPEKAKFAYGHYLTVIGVALHHVFCQDSSEDNVTKGSGTIAERGRVLIDEATWMENWFDRDADGNRYVRYGIVVSSPQSHFTGDNGPLDRLRRRLVSPACFSGWDESKHPRGEHGRFDEAGGGSSGSAEPDNDVVPGLPRKLNRDDEAYAGHWLETQSPLHVNAIREYSGCYFHGMNSFLRGDHKGQVGVNVDTPQIMREKAALVQDALLHAPHADEPVVSYRAALFHKNEDRVKLLATLQAAAASGDALEIDGFQSATTSPEMAQVFLWPMEQDEPSILMEIHSPRLSYIASVSSVEREKEILHPHGCTYHVRRALPGDIKWFRIGSATPAFILEEDEDKPPVEIPHLAPLPATHGDTGGVPSAEQLQSGPSQAFAAWNNKIGMKGTLVDGKAWQYSQEPITPQQIAMRQASTAIQAGCGLYPPRTGSAEIDGQQHLVQAWTPGVPIEASNIRNRGVNSVSVHQGMAVILSDFLLGGDPEWTETPAGAMTNRVPVVQNAENPEQHPVYSWLSRHEGDCYWTEAQLQQAADAAKQAVAGVPKGVDWADAVRKRADHIRGTILAGGERFYASSLATDYKSGRPAEFAWDETKHPRGEGGRFTNDAGGVGWHAQTKGGFVGGKPSVDIGSDYDIMGKGFYFGSKEYASQYGEPTAHQIKGKFATNEQWVAANAKHASLKTDQQRVKAREELKAQGYSGVYANNVGVVWDQDALVGTPADARAKVAKTGTPEFKAWFGDSKITDAGGKPLVVYHGTPSRPSEHNNRYIADDAASTGDKPYKPFNEFITDGGGSTDSGWLGRGSYFTPDPDFAYEFGDTIMPCYLSLKNPFVIHDDSSNSAENTYLFLKSIQHLEGLPKAMQFDTSPLPEKHEFVDWRNQKTTEYLRVEGPYKGRDGKTAYSVLKSYDASGKGGFVEGTGGTPEMAIWKYRNKNNYEIGGFLLNMVVNIGPAKFTEMLKKAGHDGVVSYKVDDDRSNPRMSEAVAFEPTQIKSAIANNGNYDPKDPRIDFSADWDVNKHPRGEHGKFSSAAGGGNRGTATPVDSTLVDDSDRSKEAVRAAGKAWAKGMSRDEREFISDYTDDGYIGVNKVLRQGLKTNDPFYEDRKEDIAQAAHIQDLLLAAPMAARPYSSYRGVCFNDPDKNDELIATLTAAKETGEPVRLAGFTSTSLSVTQAEEFADNSAKLHDMTSGDAIVLCIETRRQSHIKHASCTPEEDEVLHPHGCQYTVTDIANSPEKKTLFVLREREDLPPKPIDSDAVNFDWDETRHPRGEHGKWAESDGGDKHLMVPAPFDFSQPSVSKISGGKTVLTFASKEIPFAGNVVLSEMDNDNHDMEVNKLWLSGHLEDRGLNFEPLCLAAYKEAKAMGKKLYITSLGEESVKKLAEQLQLKGAILPDGEVEFDELASCKSHYAQEWEQRQAAIDQGEKWAADLPPEQIEATFRYTDGEYLLINEALRNSGPHWRRYGKSTIRDSFNLQEMLLTAPKADKPYSTFRGIAFDSPEDCQKIMVGLDKAMATGDAVSFKGFMSTAMESSTAGSFAKHPAHSHPNSGFVLEIRTRRQSVVESITHTPGEFEVILPHGCQFRVTGKRKGFKGRTEYILEEREDLPPKPLTMQDFPADKLPAEFSEGSWDETRHPRGEHGRWAESLGDSGSSSAGTVATDDDKWSGDVRNDLDFAKDVDEVKATLEHYKAEQITIQDKPSDLYKTPGGGLIEFDGTSLYTRYYDDANEFVSEAAIDSFFPNYEDFLNNEFWESPGPLYHATTEENWEAIQKDQDGLRPASETRGVTNRDVGGAVFTTADEDEAKEGSYGPVVLRIDTEAMKRDGLTPRIEQEPDISEGAKRETLAHIVDAENYNYDYEQGMSPNTIVMYGNVPAKYLHKV